MSYPKTGPLAGPLARIERVYNDLKEIHRLAEKIVNDDIRPNLMGKRVADWLGKTYEVRNVRYQNNGTIWISGVRVNGKRVGTRVFEVGQLSLLEIEPEAPPMRREQWPYWTTHDVHTYYERNDGVFVKLQPTGNKRLPWYVGRGNPEAPEWLKGAGNSMRSFKTANAAMKVADERWPMKKQKIAL